MKKPNWFKRKWIWFRLMLCRIFYSKNDEKYLQAVYKIHFGKKANLDNPQTFNEKLMWLKLYWRDERCYRLVDKYEVKEYVKECGLEHILLKNYGVYDSFDELAKNIKFEGKKLVIKTTHDCGGVWIVSNKEELLAKKKSIIRKLKKKVYNHAREWVYYKVKPRLIVEEFLETESGKAPWDYKIFCFNGKARFLFVATDRPHDIKFDFFDLEWNNLHIINGHPNADFKIPKPNRLDEMIAIAEKLSSDFPHVRVDFYYENDQIYFGELTFFHFGGNVKFEPNEFDCIFGKHLCINNQFKEKSNG